jgi:hypothetical protein
MISPAAAELIRRCREQIRTGIECALGGQIVLAEVWFRSANASLAALHALLDEPLQKPLRKLCIVGVAEAQVQDRDPLPAWMNCKHGDDDGAA